MRVTGPISSPIEFGLRFIGLWPHYAYAKVHRFAWAITLGSMLVFQYWYLVAHVASTDLPDLMDSLSITLSNTVLFFKLTILWSNHRLFHDVLRTICEDWEECNADRWSVDVMSRNVNWSGRFANYIMSAYSMGIVFFLSIALFAKEKNLVLRMELPFDSLISPVYEIVTIVQYLQEITAATTAAMTNALVMSLILHVGGQVDIVCQGLVEVSVMARKQESCGDTLKYLIAKHQKIITMSSNIENMFTYIALIQFLSNTMVICFLGFVIATSFGSADGVFTLVKVVPYYVLTNIEAFILCFAGEYLSLKSKTIGVAAYESIWYELKPTESRFMLLLILRSQRHLAITIGKFMCLSLEGFASMLKASASYFSVLYAMY